MARWTRHRFGASSFEELGLPGGEMVDVGLSDLAHVRETVESLLVSLAAPRLRREGVPVGEVLKDPEDRLYELLCETSGDLAAFRYRAHLDEMTSFANACGGALLEGAHP